MADIARNFKDSLYQKGLPSHSIVVTSVLRTGSKMCIRDRTSLAVRLAAELKGEIISADSRQIYRGMDLGTGKDLDEYVYEGRRVPYHLIDIADAGFRDVYKRQIPCLARRLICWRERMPGVNGKKHRS